MAAQRIVLITGCGPGGIGTALAQEFRRRGCAVIATGRSAAETDPDLLNEAKHQGGDRSAAGGISTLELDVTSADSIAEAVASVEKLFPDRGLDILVNNAGICLAGAFADTSTLDLQRILDVNVVGVWAVTRAFLPLLRRASGRGGRNSIVANIGSINEVLCPAFLSAYNASKAFVMAMSRSSRRELAPLGISVVVLKTGGVQTRMKQNGAPLLKVPEGSWYTPLKEWIESWKFLELGSFMAPEDYARGVVHQLLKERPKSVIWRGGYAWLTWLVSWLGWETMMDGPMIKGNGLHKLAHAKSD